MTDPRPLEETIPQLQALLDGVRALGSSSIASDGLLWRTVAERKEVMGYGMEVPTEFIVEGPEYYDGLGNDGNTYAVTFAPEVAQRIILSWNVLEPLLALVTAADEASKCEHEHWYDAPTANCKTHGDLWPCSAQTALASAVAAVARAFHDALPEKGATNGG